MKLDTLTILRKIKANKSLVAYIVIYSKETAHLVRVKLIAHFRDMNVSRGSSIYTQLCVLVEEREILCQHVCQTQAETLE